MRGTIGLAWAAGLLALVAGPAAAKDRDLAQALRGTWRVEPASMFPGGVLPVDRRAPRAVQEEQLEEALEDVQAVAFEFSSDAMTLVVGEERHVSSFALERTDKRTVHFAARERGKPAGAPADKLRAVFVDDDTVKLSKDGDPQILLLKRSK
ncbi:MAG: hypothetical protein ABW221_09160 [Vicinamibacteria bacterium]